MQSKFRYLNEQLYTQSSVENGGAVKMFMTNPEQFEDYHDGYRQQVQKWPKNPLDVLSQELSKIHKYKGLKIADFGCGEGKLHLDLIKSGHPKENLFSFDAGKPDGPEYAHITQSDIAKVPLESNSIDICVFCLSLMGINFPEFLKEANRVLKQNGKLFIAEVLSRFEEVKLFSEFYLKEFSGFKLLKLSKLKDFFYVMVFEKEQEVTPIFLNSAKFKYPEEFEKYG